MKDYKGIVSVALKVGEDEIAETVFRMALEDDPVLRRQLRESQDSDGSTFTIMVDVQITADQVAAKRILKRLA